MLTSNIAMIPVMVATSDIEIPHKDNEIPWNPFPGRDCLKGRREEDDMAKRILVPLDDSETGYSVLRIVADIARSSGGSVRLIHVAPLPSERVSETGRVVAYQSQEMERIAFDRLKGLRAAEAELEGVPVESVVRFGNPSREILVEGEAFGADLIAVSEKPRRWLGYLLGGIVGKLLRRSRVPVLLLAAR